MSRRLHAGDHAALANNLNNLAVTLVALNRPAEAAPLMQQVVEMRQRLAPSELLVSAHDLNNLASVRALLGEWEQAESAMAQALEMYRRGGAGDHPEVTAVLNNLAVTNIQLGRREKAESSYLLALEMMQRLYPGDHPAIAEALNDLAMVKEALGQTSEAEPLLRQGLEMARRLHAGPDEITALLLHHHAGALAALDRPDEALPEAREAVAQYRTHPEWNSRANEAAHAEQVLAGVFATRSDRSEIDGEVELCLRKMLALVRATKPIDEGLVAGWLARLGAHLLQERKPAEAEPILRECCAIRARLLGEDDPAVWLRHNSMSMLGETIARQGRFADAEPLLIDGYKGLKDASNVQAPTANADHRRDALRRIVELYDHWHAAEPDDQRVQEQLAHWQTVLAKDASERAPPNPLP